MLWRVVVVSGGVLVCCVSVLYGQWVGGGGRGIVGGLEWLDAVPWWQFRGGIRLKASATYEDTNWVDGIDPEPWDSVAYLYPVQSDTESVWIMFTWDNGMWQPMFKQVVYRDSSVMYTWYGGHWVFDSREVYRGDTVISYRWDNNQNQWEPVRMTIHTKTRPVDTIWVYEQYLGSWIPLWHKLLFYTGQGGILDSSYAYDYLLDPNTLQLTVNFYYWRMLTYDPNLIKTMLIDTAGGTDTIVTYWVVDASGHVIEMRFVSPWDSTICRIVNKNTNTLLHQAFGDWVYPLDSFFAGRKRSIPDIVGVYEWLLWLVSDTSYCMFCVVGGSCPGSVLDTTQPGKIGYRIRDYGLYEAVIRWDDIQGWLPYWSQNRLYYMTVTAGMSEGSGMDALVSDEVAWWYDPGSEQLFILEEDVAYVGLYTVEGRLVAWVTGVSVVPLKGIRSGVYVVRVGLRSGFEKRFRFARL